MSQNGSGKDSYYVFIVCGVISVLLAVGLLLFLCKKRHSLRNIIYKVAVAKSNSYKSAPGSECLCWKGTLVVSYTSSYMMQPPVRN